MIYLSLKVITNRHFQFCFVCYFTFRSSPRYCNNIFIILNGCCFYVYKGRHLWALPRKTLIYCFSLNPPTKSPLKFLSIKLQSPGKIEALW